MKRANSVSVPFLWKNVFQKEQIKKEGMEWLVRLISPAFRHQTYNLLDMEEAEVAILICCFCQPQGESSNFLLNTKIAITRHNFIGSSIIYMPGHTHYWGVILCGRQEECFQESSAWFVSDSRFYPVQKKDDEFFCDNNPRNCMPSLTKSTFFGHDFSLGLLTPLWSSIETGSVQLKIADIKNEKA